MLPANEQVKKIVESIDKQIESLEQERRDLRWWQFRRKKECMRGIEFGAGTVNGLLSASVIYEVPHYIKIQQEEYV